jgi:hypothetical protein
MNRLAKLLFPKTPRMVGCHKLRVLGLAACFGTLGCLAVSAAIFLLNWAPVH